MNGTRGNSRSTAMVLGVVVLGMAYVVGMSIAGDRMAALATLNVAVAMVGAGAATRAAGRWISSRSALRSRTRVLLLGAGPEAQHVAREAEQAGYEVLGYVEDPEAASQLEWPRGLLGPREALPTLVRELRVEQVIVAGAPSKAWDLVDRLGREAAEVAVYVVPEQYELAVCGHTSHRIGDVALYRVRRPNEHSGYNIAKRVLDVTLSLVVLVLAGPFLLLAMLATRLSSAGPVLFRQERVGKDGLTFEIVKLRTMVVDAEKDGPQLCQGTRDPRLTTVGSILRKTHLDELPQLWNVLRGEMSLVGPRPERPCFVEQFERELPRYAERHRIVPGITGLAQMNGYYHSTAREKLRFDLMYAYHPSLWQDLCIMFRTAMGVFH